MLGEDALLLHARGREVDERAGVSSHCRLTHPWRMLMPPPVPVTQPSL